MRQLAIEIAAYSPEASGRSERVFRTHQDRLVKELAMAGITDMQHANDDIDRVYLPAYNAEFATAPQEPAGMFVPWGGSSLKDILCEQFERVVGNDNCVRFNGLVLQIPQNQYRCHYVRVKIRVHRYPNGTLALFHGPRRLASYDTSGNELSDHVHRAA